MNDIKLTEKQISLIVSALDFADKCKPIFLSYLRQDGEEVANYADQRLRRTKRKIAKDFLNYLRNK